MSFLSDIIQYLQAAMPLDSQQLACWIPEWERLIRPGWNFQHANHDFPLDIHCEWVIQRTRESPYYHALSPDWQRIAILAAFFHDIEKYTGPQHLHAQVPVDRIHPIKSAETSRRILTRMGADAATISRVYTLVQHHQAFGRLFIRYKGDSPPHTSLIVLPSKCDQNPC